MDNYTAHLSDYFRANRGQRKTGVMEMLRLDCWPFPSPRYVFPRARIDTSTITMRSSHSTEPDCGRATTTQATDRRNRGGAKGLGCV